MLRAAMMAFLNASGVDRSGLGAPSRTATPMPTRTALTRLPACNPPDLSSSSIEGAAAMITSYCPSPRTFFRLAGLVNM